MAYVSPTLRKFLDEHKLYCSECSVEIHENEAFIHNELIFTHCGCMPEARDNDE